MRKASATLRKRSANATTMAPTPPDTRCQPYHLTYARATRVIGKHDARKKYGPSFQKTLVMGLILEVKLVKGPGGKRKRTMVHVLFPISDYRTEKKWMNINQLLRVPDERQLPADQQGEKELETLITNLLFKIRQNMVEDGTLQVVATMGTVVQERKLVQQLLSSNNNNASSSSNIQQAGATTATSTATTTTNKQSNTTTTTTSTSSRTNNPSSSNGTTTHIINHSPIADRTGDKVANQPKAGDGKTCSNDDFGGEESIRESDDESSSFAIHSLPASDDCSNLHSNTASAVNEEIDKMLAEDSENLPTNITIQHPPNKDSSVAIGQGEQLQQHTRTNNTPTNNTDTSHPSSQKIFVFKACVTPSNEMEKVLYELVGEEMVGNRMENLVTGNTNMRRCSNSYVGGTNPSLKSGNGIHLTPTKEKRKFRDGRVRINQSKQGKCRICDKKTSHICSECKCVDGTNEWLCHSKTGRDCFHLHCCDKHS